MTSMFAPMHSTPNFCKTPLSERASARFSAVCPPTVGRRAWGLSRAMMVATVSVERGSM
jgi:hypothetical protein